MASPILHIKDSFYFEVPKSLWPVRFGGKEDFVGSYETWLRLDPDFQLWEAARFYDRYAKMKEQPDSQESLVREYVEWKHDHEHAGKPFWRFLAESRDKDWYEAQLAASPSFAAQWRDAIEATSGSEALAEYRTSGTAWAREKLDGYGKNLSGKILIPQPFGRLRNLYEKEWGLCISRFMLIEVGVALVLWGMFSWLGQRVSQGDRPRGPLWNLLEAFVVFLRDEVARPVIGHEEPKAISGVTATHGTHDEVGKHGGTHAEKHADKHADSEAAGHGTGHGQEHGEEHGDGHHHDPQYDADRFVPLLLTIFFFVLGCNLAGMLPWVGAPTGEWGTTSAIAIVTFGTGVLFGIRRFGLFGYVANQIPAMDLPLVMAVFLKPLVLAIELLGLLIKHAILSVRLLANMVAGHIVLLSVMALAFSIEGTVTADGAINSMWPITAVISIFGSTLLSCLELFVAFLQAYVFVFLSAMFIGAAIHHH